MRMNDIVTLGRLSLTTTLSSTITGEFLTTTFTETKKDQAGMQEEIHFVRMEFERTDEYGHS